MNDREYVIFLLGADDFDVCRRIRRLCIDEGMDTIFDKISVIADEIIKYDNLLPNRPFYDNFTNFVDNLYTKEIFQWLQDEIETFHVIPVIAQGVTYFGELSERIYDVYDFEDNESVVAVTFDEDRGLCIYVYNSDDETIHDYYPTLDLVSDTQDLKKLLYIFEGVKYDD